MILQTPILALLTIAAVSVAVALWAALFGLRVLRRWDIASGSAAQIGMERQTQLASTLLGFVMVAQAAGLALFVFNADRMTPLFVGAMCAVGTLSVNAYGFPALYARLAVFFAAGLWLMLDRADRLGADYPLTRAKFGAAIGVAALLMVSAGLDLAYFLNLRTDVITSCCSRLFTPANSGLAAELSALPPRLALGLLAGAGLAVAATGAQVLWRGRGHQLYAIASGAMFVIAIAAIVAAVSSYVYEHPNHHCPFCLLKREYGYVGYALYVPLLIGSVLGLGAGMLHPATRIDSLAPRLPTRIRRQVVASLTAFALFGAATAAIIATSNLILFP